MAGQRNCHLLLEQIGVAPLELRLVELIRSERVVRQREEDLPVGLAERERLDLVRLTQNTQRGEFIGGDDGLGIHRGTLLGVLLRLPHALLLTLLHLLRVVDPEKLHRAVRRVARQHAARVVEAERHDSLLALAVKLACLDPLSALLLLLALGCGWGSSGGRSGSNRGDGVARAHSAPHAELGIGGGGDEHWLCGVDVE